MPSIEEIAEVTHALNKEICTCYGDTSQTSWESAPQWQKDSAIAGVRFHKDNPLATPADSHKSWSREKVADGWVYGTVKDIEKKTHPCLVPYEQLSKEQQVKDYVFRQTVHSMLKLRGNE